jgi:hypothetical protein
MFSAMGAGLGNLWRPEFWTGFFDLTIVLGRNKIEGMELGIAGDLRKLCPWCG